MRLFSDDPNVIAEGKTTMQGDGKSLLIYAPVPLHRKDGELFLEDQARNGLRLWAENFGHLIVMMPVTDAPMPPSWGPLDLLGEARERMTIVPLPMAYRPDQFLKHLPAVRRQIRDLIAQADYLSFSIGGLFGDWGSVACNEAWKLRRPYGVWTDRVESEVMRRAIGQGNWRQNLRARLYHRPMAALERRLIRRAAVGLFHGRETYETYAPFCRNPQLVHDIHLKKADHITPEQLKSKAALAQAGQGPLRIVYLGRADPMKGPHDWVEVLRQVGAAGVEYSATWLGDGSEMEQMKAQIATYGMGAHVQTPGFSKDRSHVLTALREAQIFLFCHKTPESPRCLIEALVSGTPIVGYDGAFASDLIHDHGGGVLSPLNDTVALARNVIALAQNPARLSDMILRAAQDGAPYDDETVFRHRSELLRAHLTADRP